jgi:hypothetical protein
MKEQGEPRVIRQDDPRRSSLTYRLLSHETSMPRTLIWGKWLARPAGSLNKSLKSDAREGVTPPQLEDVVLSAKPTSPLLWNGPIRQSQARRAVYLLWPGQAMRAATSGTPRELVGMRVYLGRGVPRM